MKRESEETVVEHSDDDDIGATLDVRPLGYVLAGGAAAFFIYRLLFLRRTT